MMNNEKGWVIEWDKDYNKDRLNKFIYDYANYKKFASLERRVGETLHVANDFVRCLSHCVGEAFQNLFYAQNQLIDITYIQKLSTFF